MQNLLRPITLSFCLMTAHLAYAADWSKGPSGSTIRDVTVGSGAEVSASSVVAVRISAWAHEPQASDYKGREVFRSRAETRRIAAAPTLGRPVVTQGPGIPEFIWLLLEQDIVGMRVGGTRIVVLPAGTLDPRVLEVEVLRVTPTSGGQIASLPSEAQRSPAAVATGRIDAPATPASAQEGWRVWSAVPVPDTTWTAYSKDVTTGDGASAAPPSDWVLVRLNYYHYDASAPNYKGAPAEVLGLTTRRNMTLSVKNLARFPVAQGMKVGGTRTVLEEYQGVPTDGLVFDLDLLQVAETSRELEDARKKVEGDRHYRTDAELARAPRWFQTMETQCAGRCGVRTKGSGPRPDVADDALGFDAIEVAKEQLGGRMLTCGDSTFFYESSGNPELSQLRGAQFSSIASPLNDADRENGYEWRGRVVVLSNLFRSVQLNRDDLTWPSWLDGSDRALLAALVSKRDGKWAIQGAIGDWSQGGQLGATCDQLGFSWR